MNQNDRFFFILGLTAVFLVIVFAGFGFPENTQAFVWLAMIVVLCLATMVDKFWYISAFFLVALFLLVLVGYESDHLVDIRGGRRGIEIRPGEIRFSYAGENSRLLEDFLGPSKAEWTHAHIRHMLFRDWRDGNERFHTRSIIFREYLPEILDLLPHRDARVQVLECSTDPNNIAKLHQEMLLLALKELGYPRGYDAQSWWDKHKVLFVSESNPTRAAVIFGGWVSKLETLLDEKTSLSSRHAYNARRAGVVDDSLVDDLLTARAAGKTVDLQKHGLRDLGVDKIAWWPVAKKP